MAAKRHYEARDMEREESRGREMRREEGRELERTESRRRELDKWDMFGEDYNSHANMPEGSMIKMFPKIAKMRENPVDDTIRHSDRQQENDDVMRGAKPHKV